MAFLPMVLPLLTIIQAGFVLIRIGLDRREYLMSRALLTFHSEYFGKVLSGPATEATEQALTLDNVEPTTFILFKEWMESGTLPENRSEWIRVRDDGRTVVDRLDDAELVTALTKAYIFADRFSIPLFQRAVRYQIIHLILHERVPTWLYALALAFQSLPRTDTLLGFLIDVHCKSFYTKGNVWARDFAAYDDERDEHERWDRLSRLPSRLLLELLARFDEKANEDHDWLIRPLDPCDYHDHSEEEERAKCERREEKVSNDFEIEEMVLGVEAMYSSAMANLVLI